MAKRLKKYIAFVRNRSVMDMSEEEKAAFRREMLVQIGFFQHERLIHLIVTLAFAILTVMSVYGCYVWPNICVYIFTGLLLVLLIPYIRHYFILERGVRKLYEYYDKLSQGSESG